MKPHEFKEQEARLSAYRALEAIRDQVRAALSAVTEPWPTGPHGQGPFTGNTRESRQIDRMSIHFTATRGGAPAVSLEITHMHISAYELGLELEAMLQTKLDFLNSEMEQL